MAKKIPENSDSIGIETILTHTGRYPDEQLGFVNTPVTRGSTVLSNTLDDFETGARPFGYGRPNGPNSRSVGEIITALEGAAGTVLVSSGLAAVSTALFSCLSSGDELLVTDSAYGPTRRFCETILKRFGITTIYYDPRTGGEISELITERTRAIYMESPGSLTFEIQDVPAIVAAARSKNEDIVTLIDNTWATPLNFKPLDLGVDMVVHAGTKMFVGHSDAMFGTASANERTWKSLRATQTNTGVGTSPDDAFLAARGLRTLALRMKEHHVRALEMAEWLEAQPAVAAVLHPGLPSHPDHALFKRDFSGAGSLFSFIMAPAPRKAVAAFVDGMNLFGMGASWGGYESLILPSKPAASRTAVPWVAPGNLFRLHIGFETTEDLKADLSAGLERYRAEMD